MKLECLPIGQFEENIYILHDNNQVLIIDPGAHAKEIIKHIDENEEVLAILLTHGHSDHTGAVDDLVDIYNCPIYLSKNEFPLVDKNNNHRNYAIPIYSEIRDITELNQIGKFTLKVYETPGHTSGSVCIQYKNILFTGDTLFSSSIGRTDLYSGNDIEMYHSLLFLKSLDKDFKVYPGHGPSTMIGDELIKNPFLINI